LNLPALHSQIMVDARPSALRDSTNHFVSGLLSMIQDGSIDEPAEVSGERLACL
jgi:hypothetical protein